MRDAREILRRLVATPTVSSMTNGPLLDLIESILAPAGWVGVRQPYPDPRGIEKANLLMTPGRLRERLPEVELLFVCHTDTVPGRREWTGATELEERDGSLHGLGACDVKGALAGLLAAALAVGPEAPDYPVAYAFTAEEEIGCIGAGRLVASGAVRPRRVIVCEPTSLVPATAGKGYGLVEVLVSGREAHSAFPDRGVSAIEAAAELIVAIERRQREGERVLNHLFDPPYTTFNVGVIEGGSAKNIIPGGCRFLVEWRPLPEEDPGSGREMVAGLAREVTSAHPGVSIEVRSLRTEAGFRNADPRLGDLLGALRGRTQSRSESRSESGSRARTGISFGSEATRFSPIAREVVVIGPGEMETAHSERESIPVGELGEWTEMVRSLLVDGVEAGPEGPGPARTL